MKPELSDIYWPLRLSYPPSSLLYQLKQFGFGLIGPLPRDMLNTTRNS